MPTAEIIAIGTELLLGEIQDTNTAYLARALRDHAIDIYRTMMIGDNPRRVADAINEALSRADIVITTGGLGPTVDDPTREAAALAFGVQLEYRPELWEQIKDRFMRFNRTPTENNRRQAYIPTGSLPVENPVGTAPCFIMERGEKCLFVLPGVPKEMEFLLDHAVLPYLKSRYHLKGMIKAKVLHTIGLGESLVDDRIGDLELLSNPTVGLLAHSGQVDVRITAKADNEEEADLLIAGAEEIVRARLGSSIFGSDGDRIEGVIAALLHQKDLRVLCILRGLDPTVVEQGLMSAAGDRVNIISDTLPSFLAAQDGTVVVRLVLEPVGEKHQIDVETNYDGQQSSINRSFGGPPALAQLWALNAMYAALFEILTRVDPWRKN